MGERARDDMEGEKETDREGEREREYLRVTHSYSIRKIG
jgi:hypothetical protein